MKSFIFLVLMFLPTLIFSQFKIHGKVKDTNHQPIAQAIVYLDGTTFKVNTDEKGNFIFNVPERNYQLVAKKEFYQIQIIPVIKNSKSELNIILKEEEIQLDEAIVSNLNANERAYFIKEFKRYFLGRPLAADKCKILNEKDIRIRYDKHNKLLKVSSKLPLEIENKYLGYTISYDLLNFEVDYKSSFVSMAGLSSFKELSKSSNINSKYLKNRKDAYLGSIEHFIKSAYHNNLNQDGFILRRLIRKENPAYLKYKEEIMNNLGQINVSQKIPPKIITILIDQPVSRDSLIENKENKMMMKFEGLYAVEFTNAKEDLDFSQRFRKTSLIGNQRSVFSLLNPIQIFSNGSFDYPEDLIVEEYWSYKKIADLLPIDYVNKP